MTEPIRVARIETVRLRAEASGLPSSSHGTMRARNGLLVKVEDAGGAFGWGEVWCNFPPHAAASRQQLLEAVIAPELVGERFAHPRQVRPHLEARWTRMATHVGEPGPFGHCIAGLDMAVWDLQARRRGQPLATLLNGAPADSVPVYASTLDPARAPALAGELVAAGHNAFKVKVGHDADRDEALVHSVREAIGAGPAIMVDANQAWSVAEAAAAINRLARHGVSFAEEPLSALAPVEDWVDLARQTDVRWPPARTSAPMPCTTPMWRPARWHSISPTWQNGAASAVAPQSAAWSSTRVSPTAPTSWARPSAWPRRCICWQRSAAPVLSNWTRTPIRCARRSATSTSASRMGACGCLPAPASGSSRRPPRLANTR